MRLQPSSATPVSLAALFVSLPSSFSQAQKTSLNDVLKNYLGMSDAIALSSLMRNTCAAVLAAKKRIPEGSKIILPRYACPSFIHGIQAAGMPYGYCDSDPNSLSISLDTLVKISDSQVGALLVPNLFGYSADMSAIAELCRNRNWILLEGADYTLGGEMSSRPLGSFGDYTILNFQEGKALPIGGGMALSREANQFSGIKGGPQSASLKAAARSFAYSILIRPNAYGVFTEIINLLRIPKKQFSMEDTIRTTRSEFDFSVGESRLFERISPFQAALGCRLWSELPGQLVRRRDAAEALIEALSKTPSLSTIVKHPELSRLHYIRLPVLIADGKRDPLCRYLNLNGFEASPMYVEHGMKVNADEYPGAARLCQELLTLPCHSFMQKKDVSQLADIIHSFLSK